MTYSPRDEALTIARGYRPRTINLVTNSQPTDPGRYTADIRQPIRDAVYAQPDPVRCVECDSRGVLTNENGHPLVSADNQTINCPACDGLGAEFSVDPRLPTDFAPGSWQKHLIIQARYELGSRLFIDGDRVNMEGMSFPGLIEPETDDDDDFDLGGGSCI